MNEVWTSLTATQQQAALVLVQDSLESLLHEPKNWVPWAMTSQPDRVSVEITLSWSLPALDDQALAMRRTAEQIEAEQIESLVRIVKDPDAGD